MAESSRTSQEKLQPAERSGSNRHSRSLYERAFPLKVRAIPNKEESPRVSEWLTTYMGALFSVSVFGGSITFTVVVNDLYDPTGLPTTNRATFSMQTIRLFIALGWMFFTFSFGISAISMILYNNESLKYVPRERWGFVDFMLKLMVPVLSLTPILAFACLSLAVAAYAPFVGWFVLGWIGLYFVVVTGLIIYVTYEGVSFLHLPQSVFEDRELDQLPHIHEDIPVSTSYGTNYQNPPTRRHFI